MNGGLKTRRELESRPTLLGRLGEIDPPRSSRAGVALARVIACPGPAISVGGGPLRAHPKFSNLNLEPFLNVEIVGDAHSLPLAASSVGAIHCEAVLEHLEHPERAVREMHRVLRPGGLVFAATPFLQVFHGYPSHFQNFTLAGHVALFERGGFLILDAGPCVGPTFAVVDIASNWARECLPTRALSRACWLGIRLVGRAIVQLDRVLLRSQSSHVLASTTFVLAERPLPS